MQSSYLFHERKTWKFSQRTIREKGQQGDQKLQVHLVISIFPNPSSPYKSKSSTGHWVGQSHFVALRSVHDQQSSH